MLTLSIVNLDQSIGEIDRPIADTVNCMLDGVSCIKPDEAIKALQSLSSTKHTQCPTLREKVEKSVMRYRRDHDKWTSFTSLLLKSLACYRSIDEKFGGIISSTAFDIDDDATLCMKNLDINETKRKLPIVDLPRTKYNRPYIPQLYNKSTSNSYNSNSHQNGEEESVNENHNSKMNVSHQYPWVCMVQQQLQSRLSSSATSNSKTLGLDVVVFNARLSSYTPTISDFLKSFVDSFTPWEWKRINSYTTCKSSWRGLATCKPRSDTSQLREFYLRWAMKEAYTKALGLGLNVEFKEFETCLVGVDIDTDSNNDGGEEGIWCRILKQRDTNKSQTKGEHQLSLIGKVKRIKPPTKWEYWEFIFIPLNFNYVNQSNEASTLQTPTDESSGACACVCRGPVAKNAQLDAKQRNPVKVCIEPLTLRSLIELHGGNTL